MKHYRKPWTLFIKTTARLTTETTALRTRPLCFKTAAYWSYILQLRSCVLLKTNPISRKILPANNNVASMYTWMGFLIKTPPHVCPSLTLWLFFAVPCSVLSCAPPAAWEEQIWWWWWAELHARSKRGGVRRADINIIKTLIDVRLKCVLLLNYHLNLQVVIRFPEITEIKLLWCRGQCEEQNIFKCCII